MPQKSYFVFVGDVALDEYYRAERWPDMDDKALVETLPAVPGGMIANAACVAAALGADVRFSAILNSGAITKFLLSDLNSSGVDTSLVVYDDKLCDSKTMIFIVGDENTIFIPTLNVQRFEISRAQLDALAGAKYIYSTPGEMRALRCGEMDSVAIIDYCREHGAKLVYDLDVDYIRDGSEERFRRLDIAFFNAVGYREFCAGRSDEQAAARLLELGVQTVVVTRSSKGCDVYTAAGQVHADARKVDVVDVTGAGDTFCSSFLCALDDSGDVEYAARFANAAASICVGKMGARGGAVPKEEVLALL